MYFILCSNICTDSIYIKTSPGKRKADIINIYAIKKIRQRILSMSYLYNLLIYFIILFHQRKAVLSSDFLAYILDH